MDRITRPSAATGVPSCSIAAVIAAVITATSWVSSVFPETTGAGFSAGFAAGADGAAFSLRTTISSFFDLSSNDGTNLSR